MTKKLISSKTYSNLIFKQLMMLSPEQGYIAVFSCFMKTLPEYFLILVNLDLTFCSNVVQLSLSYNNLIIAVTYHSIKSISQSQI